MRPERITDQRSLLGEASQANEPKVRHQRIVSRLVAARLLRQNKCGICGGSLTNELSEYAVETDALPEIGIEQCLMCGALWNMDEESWLDDLRGGTGILVREPYEAANAELCDSGKENDERT